MYQQSSSQPPTGGQARSLTCYNCGATDHFTVACPEPTRQMPAGLAAARAAQAAQSSETADDSQSGYGNRPYKRQKTGPIVTRFPAPTTGPVVTHYAPPPNQASAYTTNSTYYDGPQSQPYQQQLPLQSQLYTQHITPQQNIPYGPYGAQLGPNNPQGYVQPTIPNGPQGYSQPTSNITQPYSQPPLQPMSQYGFQNSIGIPYQDGYPTASIPQPYSYDPSMQYSQQPLPGQPPHVYPPFQSQSGFQGQPAQHYTPYQGLSPVQQSYGPSAPAQEQFAMQSWSQPPMVPPIYPAPTYQPANMQFQQPYQKTFRKQPYHHTPHQPPHYGKTGGSQTAPNQAPGPSAFKQGFGPPTNTYQPRNLSGTKRSFGVANARTGWGGPPLEAPAPEKAHDDADFEWDLEKIFVEEIHKDADPIGRPLPDVYDDEPILPPTYNVTAIMCKYVRPNNLEVFTRGIRFSLHWPSVKPDPVFNEIAYGSRLIALDDIESWIQQRQERKVLSELAQDDSQLSPLHKPAWPEEREDDKTQIILEESIEPELSGIHQAPQQRQGDPYPNGSADHDRAGTPVVGGSSTLAFGRSGTPSFGAEDDAWAPQPGEGQVTTSPVADPTEALLASLGVTGTPKPISQKHSGLHMSPVNMDEQSQEFYARVPIRQDSGYVSARGSCSNESRSGTDSSLACGDHRQSYNGSNPPPPPPPPLHMRRQVDVSLDSPSSDGSARFHNGTGAGPHDIQNNVTHQGGSPLTPTSAEGNGHDIAMLHERKRPKKPAPMRQVDDVTPKLRRRQPKVADAYSRRW